MHSNSKNLVPENIFFDCGGTLLKLKKPVGYIYSQIAASFNIHADPMVLEKRFAKLWSSRKINLRTSEEKERKFWYQISRKTFNGYVRNFKPLFNKLYSELAKPEYWSVEPDIKKILFKIKDKCKLYIISNWDMRLLKILKGLGIKDIFKGIYISSIAGYSKPSIKIFEYAILKSKASPYTSIYVGNEPEVDATSEKIGMKFVHIEDFKKWSL